MLYILTDQRQAQDEKRLDDCLFRVMGMKKILNCFFNNKKSGHDNNKIVNLRMIQWQDFIQIQNQNFPLVVLFNEFKFAV